MTCVGFCVLVLADGADRQSFCRDASRRASSPAAASASTSRRRVSTKLGLSRHANPRNDQRRQGPVRRRVAASQTRRAAKENRRRCETPGCLRPICRLLASGRASHHDRDLIGPAIDAGVLFSRACAMSAKERIGGRAGNFLGGVRIKSAKQFSASSRASPVSRSGT